MAEVHGHSRAAVATARKLVIAAWVLMREQRLATEVDQRKYQAKLRRVLREAQPYQAAEIWTQLTPALESAGEGSSALNAESRGPASTVKATA